MTNDTVLTPEEQATLHRLREPIHLFSLPDFDSYAGFQCPETKLHVRREAMQTCREEDVKVVCDACERLAQEHTRYKVALKSIATNTCCAGCQEAAKVAAAALAEEP